MFFQRVSVDRGIEIGFDDVSDIVCCSSQGGNRSNKLSCVTPPHARGYISTHLTAKVELRENRGGMSNAMNLQNAGHKTLLHQHSLGLVDSKYAKIVGGAPFDIPANLNPESIALSCKT